MWGETRWWPIGRHQYVKCRRRRRSFQSDFKIEGLPKMLECGVRAYLCVAAYVINSAGKHAYSQTAASQQGEGARQLVFLLPLALLCSFCFLLFFVLFSAATFQLFPFPLAALPLPPIPVCVFVILFRIILNCLLL